MSTRALTPTVAPVVAAQPQGPVLQRTCDCGQHVNGGECEDCKKKKKVPLQRHANGSASPVAAPPIVHDVLNSSGEPLEKDAHSYFSSQFRYDFSHVRVHTNEQAAESARAVSAHAYTVGRHVVFGTGQYSPATKHGQQVLAHELTHVIQQRDVDGIAPQSLGIGKESDEYEREAESFAGSIERGKSVQKSSVPVPSSRVQRLGFGHQILRFFGIESGSFSDDDLTEYLDRVDRNKKCDCGFLDFLSDDKARQIANQGGVGGYKLNQAYKSLSSIDLKRILIQEMLSGPTTGSDARAIIKILQDSDGDQILEILNPTHGLSMQDLDSSIGGTNHDLLVQVLEKKLPDLGKEHFKRSDKPGEKSGACTADRAVKIHQAQKRAEAAVSRTIELIDKYLQKPKEYQQVDRNLQCYFTGADAKKAAAIREDFAGINKILAKIQYVCPAEPFTEFKVTDSNGKTTVFTCEEETQALAMVQGGVNTSPTVLFCPDYFGLPPISQATIIVHEAAHHLRLNIKDVAYGPKCQSLSFESATKNADSYAYFAMALEKDGLHFDFDDCPKEWKEKIVAATQTAQLWVNTAISKVDSVIANPKSPDPAAAKQLQHHFKIDATSSNDLLQVRRGLVKIQSAFGRRIPFTCELGETSPGDEDVIGKVIGFPLIGGSLSNIHLYRPWFERLDDEHRVVTIVHEMAHKYAGKGEEAYYEHQFNTYRALNTSDLLDNADSFAQFTRYVQ